MGRRDELELNPSDDELAADEAAIRRLLASFGEPAPAEPPLGLPARVAVTVRQSSRQSPRWPRRVFSFVGSAALTVLLALGSWGVLLNSLGPAGLVGGPDHGLGQLLLLLTLAAKPLVNLLLNAGIAGLLVAIAALAACWFWWRLVRATPLVPPVERTL
jgi:hypothetical protein